MAEQPDRRFVALSIQVEVFEPETNDLDLLLSRGRAGPVMEHFTREARSLVTPLAELPDDVAEQLSGLMAHVIDQVLHRYDTEPRTDTS